MMMFGGSPTSVAVPPMLEAIASAIRNGATGTASRSHTKNVTGAISSTVVTLSSTADAAAVTTTRIVITRNGRPRARLAAQIATYSNAPVRWITATISIIPNSKKMTFQSIPDSSEKNACSASVAPISSITVAPPSAAATRCTRSVAISTYDAANTATASHAVTFTRRAPGPAARPT